MAMWITTIKHIFPKGTEILFLAHLVVSKWAFLSNLINAILRTFANIKWWCLSCIFWGNGPGQVAGFQSNLLKSGWNLPNGSNLRLKNPRLPATVSTGYYCSLQRPLKGKEYCLFKYFYSNIISKQPVSLYFELDNGKQQHLCKFWTGIQQKRESDDDYNNGNTAGT